MINEEQTTKGESEMNELINEKIELAKDFIFHHKENKLQSWIPENLSEEKLLLKVFSNLENGLYGEVASDAEYDDDGKITTVETMYQIEIGSHESKSGRAHIFDWRVLSSSGLDSEE